MPKERDSRFLDKYKDLLEDENLSYADVGRQIDDYRPPKLYRYMDFNKFWKKNVFEGQVYLSPSHDFNDPFDSLAYVDHESYAKYISERFVRACPFFSQDYIKEIADETIEQELDTKFDEIRKKLLVACFTEENDSPLMWAHYSNSHKGFCIEYDLSRLPEGYRHGIFPVIYSNERYDCTKIFVESKKNLLLNLMLYKSSHWCYEHEWRMFVPEGLDKAGENYADFSSAISAVYLGIKSSRAYEIETDELISGCNKRNIPIYQMHIKPQNYELVAERIFEGNRTISLTLE